MTDTETPPKKTRSGWLNVAIDYGPLIVFLLSFYLFRPDGDDSVGTLVAIIKSTGAFIVAAIAALIASKLLTGQISKMLMLSTVLIVGFGGMTILLRDPFYVQVKPTVLYAFFGVVLLIGWLRGKAFLQWLLEAAFEGLSQEGWLKLSRNWGFFFLFLGEALHVSGLDRFHVVQLLQFSFYPLLRPLTKTLNSLLHRQLRECIVN